MALCDHCGNDYDKAFTVTLGGRTQTFDSFECAIHMLAPKCDHCLTTRNAREDTHTATSMTSSWIDGGIGSFRSRRLST